MQLIEKVEVKYFRSLYTATITQTGDLNVLFGRNDSGKSNFLRALNMFFNNRIENAGDDFSTHFDFGLNLSDARKGAGKRFVSIKVTFRVPEKYMRTLGDRVIVKKQWNTNGQIPQEAWITPGNREMNTRNEKVSSGQRGVLTRFLNDVDFTYIPAVKDVEAFAELIERMYGAVAQTDQLQKETTRFISAIGEQAESLTDQLTGLLGAQASLAAPTDLKRLFRELDFSMGDESHSLLKQKGDGIKARYIPELLRFINENEGRSRYYIWGFEEPENSLDLEAAQKEAQRFAAYAGRGDTQVFITSHSPAFYLAQGDGQETTRRYFITKQQVLAGQAVPADAVAEIDELSQAEEKMNAAGLLELPFVISAMKEEREQRLAAEEEAAVYREEAEALREELHTLEVPTLFVEGEHDLVLFKDALERINLKDKIELKALRGTPNTASTIMKQLVKAGFNADAGAFFLFDNDEAGRKALFALCGKTSATDPIKVQGNVHAWVLPINQEYREFQQRLKIPEREATFVAEFLFPANDAARINGEILGEINDGDDAFWPVHPNVVGQVGCMLGVKHAEKEKLKHDLNRAAAHTPDFLFSRCVGNAEKHSYAERVVNEELDTAQVDAITTKVAQTLGVLEA